jgi:Peptidase A4 family
VDQAKLIGAPARLALLAWAAILAGALAPSAGAATLLSDNWAGYVALAHASVGSRFSSVSGSWRQPVASCTAGRESFSAVWVGLGGYRESRGSLEQLGTNADCTRAGHAVYTAWLELLPSAPVEIRLRVHPGERISASVTVRGSSVTLRLRNLTTGARYSTTRRYSNPDVSSAEWILEAPSTCASAGDCTTLALADVGTTSFASATATAHGHTGTILDAGWSAAALELQQRNAVLAGGGGRGDVRPASSVTLARPSAVSSADGSFSVAWSVHVGGSPRVARLRRRAAVGGAQPRRVAPAVSLAGAARS